MSNAFTIMKSSIHYTKNWWTERNIHYKYIMLYSQSKWIQLSVSIREPSTDESHQSFQFGHPLVGGGAFCYAEEQNTDQNLITMKCFEASKISRIIEEMI